MILKCENIQKNKNSEMQIIFDQFSCTSKENSDVDNFCPHEGHLPLYGFITSFRDFSIFIVAIFSPHLPHVISTDIIVIRCTKLLRNDYDFF